MKSKQPPTKCLYCSTPIDSGTACTACLDLIKDCSPQPGQCDHCGFIEVCTVGLRHFQ